MFKNILTSVWTFSLQKGWNWIWSKTTLDEKIIATAKEIKWRTNNTYTELEDVGEAVKEIGNQVSDILDAAKGVARRGRKPNKKK